MTLLLHSETVTFISIPGPIPGMPVPNTDNDNIMIRSWWKSWWPVTRRELHKRGGRTRLFFFKKRKVSKYLTPVSNYSLRVDRKNPRPPQEEKWKSTRPLGPSATKKTQPDIQRKFFITRTVKHWSRNLQVLWNLHTRKLVLQQVTTRQPSESSLNLKPFLNFML